MVVVDENALELDIVSANSHLLENEVSYPVNTSTVLKLLSFEQEIFVECCSSR